MQIYHVLIASFASYAIGAPVRDFHADSPESLFPLSNVIRSPSTAAPRFILTPHTADGTAYSPLTNNTVWRFIFCSTPPSPTSYPPAQFDIVSGNLNLYNGTSNPLYGLEQNPSDPAPGYVLLSNTGPAGPPFVPFSSCKTANASGTGKVTCLYSDTKKPVYWYMCYSYNGYYNFDAGNRADQTANGDCKLATLIATLAKN